MLSKRVYYLVLIVLLVVAAPVLSQSEGFCADMDMADIPAGIPQEECEALLAIIEANPDFTDWVDEDRTPINNSPCTWAGVTCENGGVVGLWFFTSRLSSLPPEIGQLSSLTSLYLESNQLTELPLEIGQLSSLGGLYLGNNQLAELPPEIGQLHNLGELSLRNNQLTELPPEIGQLNALIILRLSENHLTQLPSEIGQLTNLGELYLWNNQLTTLPLELVQLDNLWKLHLGSNQITSLPPEIGQFASLRVLGLSRNQLTELPPEIGQIKSLCALDVRNNQLRRIPVEFVPLLMQMTQECRVDAERNFIMNPYMLLVDGNPLVSPPPEVVEQGHEAILAYLQDETRSDTQLSIAYIAIGVGFLGLLMLLGFRYRLYKQKRNPATGMA
jgi:internalin A